MKTIYCSYNNSIVQVLGLDKKTGKVLIMSALIVKPKLVSIKNCSGFYEQ